MHPDSIPEDIFIAFGALLTIDDVFSLRKCGSKHFYWMSLSKAFWLAWINENIAKAGLWTPQHLSGLRASPRAVLERLAVRTFRLLRNRDLRTLRPRCLKNIQCNANSISWLTLYGGRWLFLASTQGTFELWDIHHDHRRRPLDFHSTGGWVCSGLVHSFQTDVDKPILVVSYSNHSSQLLECALGGHSTLTHLRTYDAASEPLTARNDLILFATSVEPEVLTLARMDGATYTLTSKVDDIAPQRIQTAVFTESDIIVFKYSTIHIYGLDVLDKPPICINPKQVIKLELTLFQIQPWITADPGHSTIHLIARNADQRFTLCQLDMDNDTGSMALTKSYVGYDWLGVGWPWIRNLAIASSNRSCVFFSGNESPHNPRIVACSIEEDRLGEFQVLWELPGPDCWDCGLYLSFDDVLGIMTIGTSQGSVWLVDFGLLGENSVFINGKANIPRELQKNPILALRSYLELPTDNSLCPPPNDFKYTSNMELQPFLPPVPGGWRPHPDILFPSSYKWGMMGSPPPSSVPQEFTLRGWSRRRSEELCFWVPWTYPSHHSEMLNLLKLPHGDFEALLIGKDEVVLFRIGSMFDLWDPFPSSVCWFPGNWTLSSFLSELRGEGLPPAVFFGDPDGDEETFEEHFRGWYTLGRLFGAVDTFGYGYDEVFCEAHLLTGEEH